MRTIEFLAESVAGRGFDYQRREWPRTSVQSPPDTAPVADETAETRLRRQSVAVRREMKEKGAGGSWSRRRGP